MSQMPRAAVKSSLHRLRQGARQMVKAVAEVAAYIETHQHEVDENGRRLVVRNGHARERTLVSGVGQLKIQAPRVDDRRVDEHFRDPAALSAAHEKRLIAWLYKGKFQSAGGLAGPRCFCRRRRWCGSKKSGDANTRLVGAASAAQRFVYICRFYSNVRGNFAVFAGCDGSAPTRRHLLAVHRRLSRKRAARSCSRTWAGACRRSLAGRPCGRSIQNPGAGLAPQGSTCSISSAEHADQAGAARHLSWRAGRRRRTLDRFKNLYEKKFRGRGLEKDRKVLLAFYEPNTRGRRTRSSPPLRRSVCGNERRVVAAAKRR